MCNNIGDDSPGTITNLSYSVEKRRDQKNCAIFGVPPLLNTITRGGGSPKK